MGYFPFLEAQNQVDATVRELELRLEYWLNGVLEEGSNGVVEECGGIGIGGIGS